MFLQRLNRDVKLLPEQEGKLPIRWSYQYRINVTHLPKSHRVKHVLGSTTVISILRAYIGNGYWKTFHWRVWFFSWRRYAVIVDTVCEVLTPGKCWKDMQTRLSRSEISMLVFRVQNLIGVLLMYTLEGTSRVTNFITAYEGINKTETPIF